MDYVILVSEKGEILGTAPKLATHNAHTPLHLAFSIFLFNSKGEVLLQQRSHTKKTWPLVWSHACCGHQKLDEKLELTAKNRMEFEMGITDALLTLILPDFRYTCELNGIVENEICPVFVGITDQQPHINPDEVENYQWMSWEKWLEEVKNRPEDYAYWCIKETNELLMSPLFHQFFQREIKKVKSK